MYKKKKRVEGTRFLLGYTYYKMVAAAMVSLARGFMMRTPWVARESVEISLRGVRMICPAALVMMMSLLSSVLTT